MSSFFPYVTAILYLTAMALHYRIAAPLCLRPPPTPMIMLMTCIIGSY